MNPSPRQFVSQIFMVPKKDGTHRPVINLKALNKFVKHQHFKMDGPQVIKDLLQKEDWMVMVDIKDAYLYIYHGSSMEPTKVWVAGPNIWILLSSVQAQQCSMSVHKSAEANSSLDPTEGVQSKIIIYFKAQSHQELISQLLILKVLPLTGEGNFLGW